MLGPRRLGQLGHGTLAGRPAPRSAGGAARGGRGVAAGDDFCCAPLTDGRVTLLGRRRARRARRSAATGSAASARTARWRCRDEGDARSRPALHHACALLGSQAVACWGGNDAGQLGLGDRRTDRGPRSSRSRIAGRHRGRRPAGLDVRAARRRQIECWGANDRGQLGLGDTRRSRRARGAAEPAGSWGPRAGPRRSPSEARSPAPCSTRAGEVLGRQPDEPAGRAAARPAYGDGANEMGDFLAAAVQGGGRRWRR